GDVLGGGDAVERLLGLFLDEAGDYEAAARRNFDGGFGAPHLQRRYGDALTGDCLPGVGIRPGDGVGLETALLAEFGDLDGKLQRDPSFGQHDRRIAETDAEGFELDGDLAFVLRDRHGELAADQE